MTTQITATGSFATRIEAPRLRISSGRGNTDRPEVHIAMACQTADGDTSYTLLGWFDAADLTDAIVEAAQESAPVTPLSPTDPPPLAA